MKVQMLLNGGPWSNRFVRIPESGTMIFSLGNWRGFYDERGEWNDEQTNSDRDRSVASAGRKG